MRRRRRFPFDSFPLAAHGTGRAANLPSSTGSRPLPRVLSRARCRRTDADTVAATERLRRRRHTGPQIAPELGLPRSYGGRRAASPRPRKAQCARHQARYANWVRATSVNCSAESGMLSNNTTCPSWSCPGSRVCGPFSRSPPDPATHAGPAPIQISAYRAAPGLYPAMVGIAGRLGLARPAQVFQIQPDVVMQSVLVSY
jgi:hypothetical protein